MRKIRWIIPLKFERKNVIKTPVNLFEIHKHFALVCIIYYNLYLLEKNHNVSEANKYLNLSYSTDFSLFRIQNEYRNSLKELHKKFQIGYIDLEDILNKNDFIDYCHPKREGHQKISDSIINLINKNSESLKKSTKNIYVNKLTSPDYFNDPTKNFIDYYFIKPVIL